MHSSGWQCHRGGWVVGSRIESLGASLPPGLAGIRRYKRTVIALLLGLCVLLSAVYLLRPAPVPDLAQGSASDLARLKADWAAGEMIVLVRHVERCDHSNASCQNTPDGITDRARDVAVELGAQFKHLGLSHTDLYNSPLTRAVQTSSYMFSSVTTGQDWLFNCKGTLLRDALAHKVAGRNLVLVTHSECMAELEKELNVPGTRYGYGTALFLSTAKGNAKAHLLGFLDATDWRSVFTQ